MPEAFELRMPSLGSDMDAGTLVKWRVAPGARVERGQIVAEVETDKGIIEVEIFGSGVVDRLLVEPGARVPVGTPLACVRGEGPTPERPSKPPPLAPPQPPAPAPDQTTAQQVPTTPEIPREHRASPLARRRARELGIELASLSPTGPHGTVSVVDVERAAKAKPAAEPKEPPSPERRMRRAVAATMARSKREIPHFYLATTIDLGPAMAWLDARNASRPIEERLVPAILVQRAVARAARAVPELNARWTGEEAERQDHVHLGIAIALRSGGLVAPAIHDADRAGLDELMRATVDLVSRARAGTLRSSEMSDPTITVTSLGERGVDTVFPIVFPPQVAIVGVGVIRKRPWVVDDAVVARPLVDVSVSVDHRAVDGHRAARFLLEIEKRLGNPEEP